MKNSLTPIHFTHEKPEEYLKTEVTGQYLLAAWTLAERLKPMYGSINHYLDFGCGAGKSTWPVVDFVNPGGTITGIDVSQAMLDLAQKHIPKNENSNHVRFEFKAAIFDNGKETIPLESCTVDVVGTSIVLQEINELTQLFDIFSEINRILKPGGHFISVCVSDKITCEDFTSFTYAFPENINRKDAFRKCKAVGIDIIWDKDYHWPANIFKEGLENSGFCDVTIDYPFPPSNMLPFPNFPHLGWKDEVKTPPIMVAHSQKLK